MKRIISIILALLLMLVPLLSLAATKGEENALRHAQSYLNYTSFSYSGLIGQLEYEGYSSTECKYAADNCGADWYEQAVLKAESYLSFMSFSKSGLIDQLEYEGFTKEEAEYGAAVAYGESPAKPETKSTANTKTQTSTTTTKEVTVPENQPKETITVGIDFDLSSLSYDELSALESRLIDEMKSRAEYKTVLVPTGVYEVGADIPAGKWTITATEGYCEVYWGKSLDEYNISVPYGERIATMDDWGSQSTVTWELAEGTYIVVNRNAVTFTPYIPSSLGF